MIPEFLNLPAAGTSINIGTSSDQGKQTTQQLYMVVAGDNQTPCRWNGRQFKIEWLDGEGVPIYNHEQAIALIDQSYRFLESVGRTAHPILRAVPVFQIKTL